MSPVADRVRGVLRPVAEGGKLRHERMAASEALAGVVQHFWSVRWDLRGAKPFVPETLPHPNVHLVFEAEGATIAGVHTGRFTTKLEDVGWVFGVKFRPGAFRPYFGRSVASLRDRSVPIDEVFGTKGAALARKVSDLGGDAEKAAAVGRFLTERKIPADPIVERVSNIVDEIAENRDIVSVDQVVELGRCGKRTLQQLFSSYVGVGPKWVITDIVYTKRSSGCRKARKSISPSSPWSWGTSTRHTSSATFASWSAVHRWPLRGALAIDEHVFRREGRLA